MRDSQLGLLGLVDPPCPEVPAAIAECVVSILLVVLLFVVRGRGRLHRQLRGREALAPGGRSGPGLG